jgi:hypothetical protein
MLKIPSFIFIITSRLGNYKYGSRLIVILTYASVSVASLMILMLVEIVFQDTGVCSDETRKRDMKLKPLIYHPENIKGGR